MYDICKIEVSEMVGEDECRYIGGDVIRIYSILKGVDENVEKVFECINRAKSIGQVRNCTKRIFYRSRIFREFWINDIKPSLERLKSLCPETGEFAERKIKWTIENIKKLIDMAERTGRIPDEYLEGLDYPGTAFEDVFY